MRVAVKKHSDFRANYDYTEIIEAESVKKELQDDECWLSVDGKGFKMSEGQADLLVNEVFKTGILDLTEYKETRIPW